MASYCQSLLYLEQSAEESAGLGPAVPEPQEHEQPKTPQHQCAPAVTRPLDVHASCRHISHISRGDKAPHGVHTGTWKCHYLPPIQNEYFRVVAGGCGWLPVLDNTQESVVRFPQHPWGAKYDAEPQVKFLQTSTPQRGSGRFQCSSLARASLRECNWRGSLTWPTSEKDASCLTYKATPRS